MKCPHDNPTIQNCINCPLPKCVKTNSTELYKCIKRWQERNPDKVRQYQKNKRSKYSPEKKVEELQRLNEWKAKHKSKVKRSIKRCGKRWRKVHREEERERNRMNYQRKKAERVS